jgi:hypothetical protein
MELRFSGLMQKVHVPAPFFFNNVNKNVKLCKKKFGKIFLAMKDCIKLVI